MIRRATYPTAIFAAFGTLILVLDSKAAISACAEAVELCIKAVIPSLFPLLVFSILLTSSLQQGGIPILSPLQRLCKMPRHSEALLLNGLIGGFPNGAQCVAFAYQAGNISQSAAERLLGFCSNAGPAFIFGIVAASFNHAVAPWVLWSLQIVSAIITGILLPATSETNSKKSLQTGITFPDAIQKATKAMVGICGWILLFRCLCTYFEKWFIWWLPAPLRIAIVGLLELTNGCLGLKEIENEALRFILCSALLSFGGICVIFQTKAVIGNLDIRHYIQGKLLQTVISVIPATFAAIWLYNIPVSASRCFSILIMLLFAGFIIVSLWKKRKNCSRFSLKTSV